MAPDRLTRAERIEKAKLALNGSRVFVNTGNRATEYQTRLTERDCLASIAHSLIAIAESVSSSDTSRTTQGPANG